jgi:hypothetical protein
LEIDSRDLRTVAHTPLALFVWASTSAFAAFRGAKAEAQTNTQNLRSAVRKRCRKMN